MFKISIFLFVLLNVSLSKSIFEYMHEEWLTFKDQFNKTYISEQEEIKRFIIFLDNCQKIKRHNDIHGNYLKLRYNKYADLEHKEFVRMMNGFNRTIGLPIHESNYIPFRPRDIPERIDWRREGAVTEVKDQGNCGSCWAFSTTGALEGQRHRIYDKLVPLSEQNLIDCSRRNGNEGCDGGLMDYAYRYIMDNKGIATEKAYHYIGENRMCKYTKEERGASITGYIDLPSGNETILKEAVALVGPISVAVDASHLSFQFYDGGIYEEEFCNDMILDHAMLVVGYGSKEGVDYWIVKNSWGSDWGDHGYIYMKRNAGNMCGIATKASYPII